MIEVKTKIKYVGTYKQMFSCPGFSGVLSKDDVIEVAKVAYKELITRRDFIEFKEEKTKKLKEKENG